MRQSSFHSRSGYYRVKEPDAAKTQLTPAKQKENYTGETKNDFYEKNTGEGILKVQAARGQQAVPTQDVRVTVSKELEGENVVFFEGVTDENGIIDNILLPSPPKNDELSPEQAQRGTMYKLTASHPDYVTKEYLVEVFDGVKAIVQVNLRLKEGK